MVETTDASKTAEDLSLSILPPDAVEVFFSKLLILFDFHPSSDFLSCQILPEEMPMQEQESDSLPIENDPVGIENDPAVVDTQTIDSLVQHTTYGKKIIYLFYPSATIMN